MANELTLRGVSAQLKSVNCRKENHGDDKVPAVDLKLEMELDADQVAQLWGGLPLQLWHENNERTPLLPPGNEIALGETVFEEHRVEIGNEGVDDDWVLLGSAKISKARIVIVGGGIAKVTLRVQSDVGGDQTSELHERLGEWLAFTCHPRQQDMVGKAAAA